MGRPLGKEVNMEKICKNCAHWCICKTWATENGVCAMHEFAPPCKIGDLLFVPVHYEDEAEWCVDIIPVNDIGQRFVFCPRILGDTDDTTETYAVDRIGVDVFLTMEEAREYVKRAYEKGWRKATDESNQQ